MAPSEARPLALCSFYDTLHLGMAFCRSSFDESPLPPDDLTTRMVGIGMSFAATAQRNADIENTAWQTAQDFRLVREAKIG